MKIGTFSEERPLAVFALCAGAGALAGRWLPRAPFFLGAAGALAGLLLWLSGLHRPRVRRAGVCVLTLFLFMLRSGEYYHRALPPAGEYTVTAIVREEPSVRMEDGHVAVPLRSAALFDDAGRGFSVSGAYWTWYFGAGEAPALPRAGDTVRFRARLYHPQGQTNPYGFDFRQYLLQRGITAGLYSDGSFETPAGQTGDLRARVSRVRGELTALTDRLFGADSALPKALLFGARQDLSEETQEAFSRAGVAHVLAVSGLHVSLLTGALGLLFGRLLSRKGRFWAALVFLAGYCLLLDFRASVVRASVLTACLLYGRAQKRRADSFSALSLSFMLIVFMQPADLISVGFLLSFGAVLGMLLLGGRLERAFRPYLGKSISAALSAALSASVGTVVPISGLFHYVSLIGLVLSPLLCALLGVLLPLYLGITALGFVWLPAAQPAAALAGQVSAWLIEAVNRAAALPYASVNVPALPWPFLPAFVLAIWCLSPLCGLKTRKRLALFGAAFALGCAVNLVTVDRGVSYTQFDMGAADCAVLQDGRRTVVVDTGEDGQDLSAYLLSTGRTVDLLVLTHLHMDHAGGAAELLRRGIPIRQVVLPQGAENQQVAPEALALVETLRARGIPVAEAAAGDVFSMGAWRLTALWPPGDGVRAGQDANDMCLVLEAQARETSFLLCADITETYEMYVAQPADILKVAHHGSVHSTSEAFLEQVNPQAALISTGANHSAARESGAVPQRLKGQGIPCYTTASGGALRVDVREGSFTVTPFVNHQE